MALKATIFKAELSVADIDRGVYGDHTLTIARHPSETDERMMVRLLAFALHADERLEFGRGLSAEDEPDLVRRDLTGTLEQWIDVGLPDEREVRKACGRAREVIVYAYGGRAVPLWWDKVGPPVAPTCARRAQCPAGREPGARCAGRPDDASAIHDPGWPRVRDRTASGRWPSTWKSSRRRIELPRRGRCASILTVLDWRLAFVEAGRSLPSPRMQARPAAFTEFRDFRRGSRLWRQASHGAAADRVPTSVHLEKLLDKTKKLVSRLMPIVVAASAGVVAPAYADFFPAGQACPFPIEITVSDGTRSQRQGIRRRGRQRSPTAAHGQQPGLVITNTSSGESYSLKSRGNGRISRSMPMARWSSRPRATPSRCISPRTVLAPRSSRISVSSSSTSMPIGVWTIVRQPGKQIDVCALLE
jgi:uncharacterized protein YaeQ